MIDSILILDGSGNPVAGIQRPVGNLNPNGTVPFPINGFGIDNDGNLYFDTDGAAMSDVAYLVIDDDASTMTFTTWR